MLAVKTGVETKTKVKSLPRLQLGSAATASEAPAAVESSGEDEDDFLPPVDEDPLVFSEEDLGSLMEPIAAVQEDDAAGEDFLAFFREVTEEHLRQAELRAAEADAEAIGLV